MNKQGQRYSAPEPVLGMNAVVVADPIEWRRQKQARTAMIFAASGAVASVIAFFALFFEAVNLRHSSMDALFGLLLLLGPLATLIGLVLGIVARKTRTGKAAILVSLTPLGLAALFALGAFVVGIVSGLQKA